MYNISDNGTFSPFFQPLRILKTNCRILRTFIALLVNSTNQLRSFQVSEGVKSQLVQLKRQTRTLLNCLRRIVAIIKFVSKLFLTTVFVKVLQAYMLKLCLTILHDVLSLGLCPYERLHKRLNNLWLRGYTGI